MTQLNLALDEFLRELFWRVYDLGIFAAIMIAATIYILWMVLKRQDFTPHHRLWAYILSVTFLADTAAILWTWGMGWGWTAMAALAPPLCVLLYLTPTIAAIYWQHPSFNSIFVVNLFTGWTLIGWVLAFRWAQRSPWRNGQFNIAARLRPSPDVVVSMRKAGENRPVQVEAVPNLRCAIYTRKSSEQGLEKDLNSLHAQRQACEAFIKSQASEGWRLAETAYEDGGLSGGTMERPALEKLLADIGQNLIDVVVVYKVDRLTRSLAEFAKMMELFNAHKVSLVGVTQQFNTTTSMGRLTLNVLLSFAQFEREVKGKRIRDKIAGSQEKGHVDGSYPPLGYDLSDRRLIVNQAEAETVREIYRLYRKLGSVRRLKEHLDAHGVHSKVRLSSKGIESGGRPFSRGALHLVLSNPIYIGEIRHKGVSHPGQHEAILDRGTWERTQEQSRNRSAGIPTWMAVAIDPDHLNVQLIQPPPEL